MSDNFWSVPDHIWAYDCARYMTGQDLPIGLMTDLDDMERYAFEMGGSIQSRQIVATAIVMYRKVKTLEVRVAELEKQLESKE